MSDQKINITVENGIKELVIREGSAPNIELEKGISITGNILAPGEFYLKRKSIIDALKDVTNVIYSKRNLEKLFINLEINERFSDQKTKINGELKLSDDFKEFSINSKKTFDLKELFNLLRFKKRFFVSPDEYASVTVGLQNFSAGSSVQVEQKNDFKGNTTQSLKRNTELKMQLSFSLNIEIFEGMGKITFPVEINFEMADGRTIFWLESIDLPELIEKDVDKAFSNILSTFSDFPCIEQ